ncbi:hypothetical protein ES703_25933 [subsurface metagenome]
MQIEIIGVVSQIVQKKRGASLLGKEMLQGNDLPAIPQRILRQKPDFGETVKNHAGRSHPLNLIEGHLRGFPELKVGRVNHCLLLLGVEAELCGDELKDLDALQIPAVGFSHLP